MENSSTPTPAPIQRAKRFEQYTAWPVFIASVLFFAATVALLSASLHSTDLVRTVQVVALVSYVVVVVDFLARTMLARGALRAFLQHYWFEAVSLVLPLLRPFVIVIYLWRLPAFRRSGATLRARLLITTFVFMVMFVYLVSSIVWLVERGQSGANIVNLDDAIWWGFATLSTVGYGDFVPVTTTGRILAVGLMLGGIAIVGTTTALVVSVLNEQVQRHQAAVAVLAAETSQAAQAAQGAQDTPGAPPPHPRRFSHPLAPESETRDISTPDDSATSGYDDLAPTGD